MLGKTIHVLLQAGRFAVAIFQVDPVYRLR
jgi:hypothetical protein